MTRPVLDARRIHPAVQAAVADFQADTLRAVQAAVDQHAVVVVGMAQNPYCRKARGLLAAAGVPFQYLEYGNYFSQWRLRSALKMWTGWPTLPMVFVRGTLVGGANDLARLIDNGELKRLLA